MAGIMDILIRARDEASAVFDKVGDSGQQAGSLIDQHLNTAAVAVSGAGLAIEGFARKQQGMTVSTRVLAARMGENEDAVRGWATEMTNAGFPLDTAVGLMDLANRRGLEGKGPLQAYAGFWDTLADATGESSVALAQAGVGLSGIGIAAGEEGEALDALGFIMDNTTQSAGDFLTFVERVGPELREMNIDIDDAAALLGVMETELGLSGRVARTEFRNAVNESDGTLKGMLNTLGLSEEQFDSFRGRIEGSGEAVARNAAIFNDAMTPMQELQAHLEDLAYSFGPVVDQAANLAPLLIAAGPAAKGAQLGMQGMAKIAPVLGTAMHAMLGPIGLVTAAIAALAIAWETDFMGIQGATEVSNGILAMHFGELGDRANALADSFGTSFDDIKTRVRARMEETGESVEAALFAIEREAGRSLAKTTRTVEKGVDEMAGEVGQFPQKAADELLAAQQKLSDATTQLVNFMDAALSPAQEKFRLKGFLSSSELAQGLASGNPMVVAKAIELRDAAQARLAELSGLAYGAGTAGGYSFGRGLQDPAVIGYIAGSARKTMLAARGVFPGSEPADPSSPLRGITTAFGFMDILADGLEHDADRPAEAMARAMGLVADELEDPVVGIGVRGGRGGTGGLSGAGGAPVVVGPLVHIEHFTGSEREMDRLADRIGQRLRLQGI